MPINHYVTPGRSGLRVSPFCLGAMTFGTDWGFGASAKDSEAILSRYFDLGGNFIDTANVYTKGHSEKIIGDWIKKKPIRRDRLVLATKFFGTLYPGDPNAGGASRKSMIAACENSLRRLRTDYIDLYWMHAHDRNTPIEETMRGLDDLIRAGKVRYAGFSDTPAWKTAQAQLIAQFRGWSPLIALQISIPCWNARWRGNSFRWPWNWAGGDAVVSLEVRDSQRQVHAGQPGQDQGRAGSVVGVGAQ